MLLLCRMKVFYCYWATSFFKRELRVTLHFKKSDLSDFKALYDHGMIVISLLIFDKTFD